LAGEAVVADSIHANYVIFSPTDVKESQPDLKVWWLVSIAEPESTFSGMHTVLEPFSGEASPSVWGKGISEVYIEVKAGFKLDKEANDRTIKQIEKMGRDVQRINRRRRRTAGRKTVTFANAVSAAKGHIETWQGLAVAATQRARDLANEGKRLRPKKPPTLKPKKKP
jgi:hypothetical protein